MINVYGNFPVLVPRLGKAERLSPFPRRKNEGKTQRQKDWNAKNRKRSPKPNVDVSSVLSDYLIFGFCKRLIL